MRKCVWVVEVGVLHATKPFVSQWEIWQAFNTRHEAVKERLRMHSKVETKRFHEATTRIMKYVPDRERAK